MDAEGLMQMTENPTWISRKLRQVSFATCILSGERWGGAGFYRLFTVSRNLYKSQTVGTATKPGET